MSFAIKLKDGRWIERHVPLTTRSFGPFTAQDVDTVQADGHELQFIQENYVGIPFGPAIVQKWTGAFARFIFNNLPY